MGMNKKGKASGMAWFVVVFIVIATVAIVGLLYRSTQQQAVVVEKTIGVEGGVTPILGTGTAATYKLFTKDLQSDTLAKVAAPITCWEKNDPGNLLADATRSDPGTATTISGTNVNGVYICEAFNATWYPVRDEYTIPKEGVSRTINIHLISRDINITVFNDNDVSLGALSDNFNITGIGSSGTNSWAKIKIENKDTDSLFRLKMIGFDLNANTNISKVEIKGWKSVDKPARLRTVLDYAFVLDSAVDLAEYEKVNTGNVVFTGDGDGCAGVGAREAFTVYFIDESDYKSGTDNTIQTGVEDDAPSPADVGRGDYTIPGTCSG